MTGIIELIGLLARAAGAVIVVLFAVLCLTGNPDAAGKVLAVGLIGAFIVGALEAFGRGSNSR